jgi:hypothetical protein
MTESERIEYQAETARLRAANVARVQQYAVNQRAYDKATRDALQALRDTDHATAVLANVMYDISTPAYVAETAVMMLRPENNRAAIVTMDHADAIVENGFRHDPEPHSRRPSECRFCGRLIASTYVEGRRDQTWHVR